MSKKMLHAMPPRGGKPALSVVDGHKVEEFDFETASRRQLAGNIYLAKITRVERRFRRLLSIKRWQPSWLPSL